MNARSPLLVTALLLALSGCAKSSTDEDTTSPEAEAAARQADPAYMINATIEPGEMAAKTGPDYAIAEGEDPGFPELHVWSKPTMDSVPTHIKIARGLAEMCKINEIDAFFAENSAELEVAAQTELKLLADCFTVGPMKGHRLAITGHTDPRGSAKHNIELGRARAEAVAAYLRSVGLAGGEMVTASEGEAEAHPDAPDLWPADRRVVLDVGEQPDEAAAPAE